MTIKSKSIIALFFIVLSFKVRSGPPDALSNLGRIEFLGVSSPFQVPKALSFKFKSEAGFLTVRFNEAKKQSGVAGGFEYIVELNDQLFPLKTGSLNSALLVDKLSTFDRSGVFEVELHDALILFQSIQSGQCINSSELKSIGNGLSHWGSMVRSGEYKILRLQVEESPVGTKWVFIGDMFCWDLFQRADGAFDLILPGGESDKYPIGRDTLLMKLILITIDRFYDQVKRREVALFDANAVKFYGPMVAEETANKISTIRSKLTSK